MSRQPVCTCGHTKGWHAARFLGRKRCMKRECPCDDFIEKPIVEVEWEP